MKTAHLQDKFMRNFIFPLWCGVFISIIFTVSMLFYYAGSLEKIDEYLHLITDLDNEKSLPILLSANSVLIQKFQGTISILLKIQSYYTHLHVHNYLNYNDKNAMSAFVNKFTFNTQQVYEEFDHIKSTLNTPDSSFLDYALWWINPTIRNLDQLSTEQLKQLYSMSHLILFFRSLYEINKSTESRKFRSVYISSPKTGLFFQYPVDINFTRANFNNLVAMPPWCKDKEMRTPQYFFFYCRPWFRQAKQYFEIYGLELVITDQYIFKALDTVGVSVCLTINNPLGDLGRKEEDHLVMCIDQVISDIIFTFEAYNNLLSGYFFIMRVHSKVPIYYPNTPKTDLGIPIKRYQFYGNFSFYVDELEAYDQLLEIFINNYPTTSDNLIYGSFKRSGIYWNYTLVPVNFFLNDYSSQSKHLLTIVYLNTQYSISKAFQQIQNDWYPRIVFQMLIFIILGCILIRLSGTIVTALAVNIVKPIKNIKKIFEGMNNKNLALASLFNDDDLAEYEDGLTGLGSSANTEENSLIKDNQPGGDDDEYLSARSQDIDNLFCRLHNIKNCIAAAKDSSLNVDKENIINYVYAKKVFVDVRNINARFLCDSNVGNLLIKCKKYDKAIFHLMESMNDPDYLFYKSSQKKHSFVKTITNHALNREINTVKTSTPQSIKFTTGSIPSTSKVITKKNKIKMEIFKKKFLDNRYPKLLYCFKKFYKNLKRIMKSKEESSIIQESQEYFGMELFGASSSHSLANYEEVLRKYLALSYDLADNQQIILALLEMNEFLINFRLRNKEYELLNSNLDNKIGTISKIQSNFQEIDQRFSEIKLLNSQEYFLKILNLVNILRKDNEGLDTFEIPAHVIQQRANYLKGKFYFVCGHYTIALNFFKSSKKISLICDASIVRSSIKKIQKIVTLYMKNIERKTKSKTEERTVNTNRKTMNKDYQEMISKSKLVNYYNGLSEEIIKFKYFEKDICVIINKRSENDEKFITSINVALKIFENMTTSSDRFALLVQSSRSTDIMINLSFKNLNTDVYIKDYIMNFLIKEKSSQKTEFSEENSPLFDDNEGEKESLLQKGLRYVYEYLKKKNFYSVKVREKWYIYITTSLTAQDKLFLVSSQLWKSFFDGSLYENVIIILLEAKMSYTESDDKYIRRALKFNKSGIFNLVMLDELKRKMKTMGIIHEEHLLPQERYENK